jgi:hypothetical protein
MNMRDPSIHIARSSFIRIMLEMHPDLDPIAEDAQWDFVNEIIKRARPHSLSNRAIVASTDRIEKKMDKIMGSTTGDADLMARMVVAVRRQLKHKGVQQIKPASRDWDTIKAMSQQANQFCEDFEIHVKRLGYIAYLRAGISKMQQFSLRKFTNLYQAICDYYQATLVIESDENTELTKKIHDYYKKKVALKTGIMNSYKDRPEKYQVFVEVRRLCKNLTVDPAIYIDAQFDGLEKFNALPDPTQLMGQKAKERLQKYMFDNNISIRKNGNGTH